MRVIISVLVWMGVSISLLASGENKFDPASTAGFLAGEYVLVGRKPDSAATYMGRVILKQRGNQFDVVRTIGKQTVNGTASFDTSLPTKYPCSGCAFNSTASRLRPPTSGETI